MKGIVLLTLAVAAVLACPDDPLCLSCKKKTASESVLETPTNPKDNECLYCQYSFFDPKSRKCNDDINSRVKECESYALDGEKLVCARCQLAFYLNKEANECIKCETTNCISCNSAQVCNACIGGLIPEADPKKEGKYKCGESKSPLPNCRVTHGTDLEGKCFKCEPGFALNNGEDKQCIKSVDNCQIADPLEPATKCFQCSSSYFIKADGTCEKHNSLSILWVLGIIVPVVVSLVIYFVLKIFRKQTIIGENDADAYQKV
jgi:hypothetical protein